MTRTHALVAAAATLAIGSVAAVPALRHDYRGPQALVTRGSFTDYLTLRGDIRPLRSVVLAAPSSGGDLQIVGLLKNGAAAARGDVVVQFDASLQERTLDQNASVLKQAEANLEKAEADERRKVQAARAEVEKDVAELARARIDLAKAEISSRIDAEKLKVAVEKAQQHLAAAQQIAAADQEAAAADVEISRQKRDKAQFDVDDTRRIIGSLTMRAPAAGTVSLLPNTRAGAAFGRNAPEFKRGDRAWFGAPIAELPDLTTVQMNARLEEADRARVQVGGAALVRVDAVPDREFHGTIRAISTVAKPDFTAWPPVRNFDVIVAMTDVDPRLRAGMNASARIGVDELRGVLLVPAAAVFQSGAASVVYAVEGRSIERRVITVVKRGRDQVVVSGPIREGEHVTLTQPDESDR